MAAIADWVEERAGEWELEGLDYWFRMEMEGPGGEVDSLRPWTQRDEAILAGRKRFVRMAIRATRRAVALRR